MTLSRQVRRLDDRRRKRYVVAYVLFQTSQEKEGVSLRRLVHP